MVVVAENDGCLVSEADVEFELHLWAAEFFGDR
jgi:hypothetical protein